MRKIAQDYYNDFQTFLNSITVTDNNKNKKTFYEGIELVCDLILKNKNINNKLIFIGNGASASISSHMAIDFSKNVGIRAIAFNDSALLTCISNDYGYKHVFEKPIEMFADKGDILFAISSSGNSENILAGVRAARVKRCNVITLSGFNSDNPLSLMGDFNFYVPAQDYGPVEVIHHSICHCILHTIMKDENG
jgi:D-sedoheptulose 7-phosphate isomerase